MIYSISKPNQVLCGKIILPASKSISNRVQIIRALCKEHFAINNLSPARDTVLLENILKELTPKIAGKHLGPRTINIEDAGTAMRFLTAFLSITEGEWILTGSARMKQRPIAELADTLSMAGAEIHYMEENGFPPLHIHGKKFKAQELSISGNISSQFISAILMIAPCLENGLKLSITGDIISRPYIEMTLGLMNYFGVSSSWVKNSITIPPQSYIPRDYTVEPDWSAASYWYGMAALAQDATLFIEGLSENSLQGDSAIAILANDLGIVTTYSDKGIHINKETTEHKKKLPISLDLKPTPDLAQTLIVTYAALGIPATFSGLESLKIKETDRVAALQNELCKTGVTLEESENGKVRIIPSPLLFRSEPPTFATYGDHRMAMSFAMLAIRNEVRIENPEVISKSYPSFWDDLRAIGFNIIG